MTNFRIHALEDLGFEWERCGATWEDRLSELADYRKSHGHCNAPRLARWVGTQRCQYKLQQEGKRSQMTLARIQALKSLNFEWKSSNCRGKGKPKKSSLDDDATRVRERAVEAPEHVQTTAQPQKDCGGREIRSNQVDVAYVPEESDRNGEVHLGYIPCRTEQI